MHMNSTIELVTLYVTAPVLGLQLPTMHTLPMHEGH